MDLPIPTNMGDPQEPGGHEKALIPNQAPTIPTEGEIQGSGGSQQDESGDEEVVPINMVPVEEAHHEPARIEAMLKYVFARLKLTVTAVAATCSRKIRFWRGQISRIRLLVLWALVCLLLVGTFFFSSSVLSGWTWSMAWRRRSSSSVTVVTGGDATAAADISRHPVWPTMEEGIDRCIPNKETGDADVRSFFRDASVAQADDMSHAMNRYLYFAIMHAVVLGSRFADDPATAILPGQKVGKDDVDRYIRTMLDTMQGEVIVASQDASAQFNEMNRFLYLTLVQANVLRGRYPTSPRPVFVPVGPLSPPSVEHAGHGIEVLEQQVQGTETKVDYMEVQLQENETKVDCIEVQLQETETKVNLMEVQLQEKEIKITYMEVQLQEKETKISYMEVQLLEKEKKIVYLEQQLQYIKVELSELHSVCNSCQTQLTDCKAGKESTCADCHEKLNDCQAGKGTVNGDNLDW